MTSSLIDDISVELLVCRICLDKFRRPKTLACRHTFCEECLEKLREAEIDDSGAAAGGGIGYFRLSSTTRRTNVARITCPVCNIRSPLPPGGVRRLPDDPVVSRLSDVVGRRKAASAAAASPTAPGGSTLCDICSAGSGGGGSASGSARRRRTAQSKCIDCNKMLCSACVRLHRRTHVTSGHSVFDLDEASTLSTCPHHPDEPVRFYCATCDVCVCVLCTHDDDLHASHDVLTFVDAVQRQKQPVVELVADGRRRLVDLRRRLDAEERFGVELKQAEDRIREAAMETVTCVRRRERDLLSALYAAVPDTRQPTDRATELKTLADHVRRLADACDTAEHLLADVGDGCGAAPFLVGRRRLVDAMRGTLTATSTSGDAAPTTPRSIRFVGVGVDSALAITLGQICVEDRRPDDVDEKAREERRVGGASSNDNDAVQLRPTTKSIGRREDDVDAERSPWSTRASDGSNGRFSSFNGRPPSPLRSSRLSDVFVDGSWIDGDDDDGMWIEVHYVDAGVQTESQRLDDDDGDGSWTSGVNGCCDATGRRPLSETSQRHEAGQQAGRGTRDSSSNFHPVNHDRSTETIPVQTETKSTETVRQGVVDRETTPVEELQRGVTFDKMVATDSTSFHDVWTVTDEVSMRSVDVGVRPDVVEQATMTDAPSKFDRTLDEASNPSLCSSSSAAQSVEKMIALLPEVARTAEVLAASHFSTGLAACLLRDVAAIGIQLAELSLSRCPRDFATNTVPTSATSSTSVQTDSTSSSSVVDSAVGDSPIATADCSTSTPSVPPSFDKETSTVQCHQIHRNVATDSQSTADKQTWMSADVAAAYLESTFSRHRVVTVSRGTNTSPGQPPVDRPPGVDRATSPVRVLRVDKAVSVSRGDALEPLDVFPGSPSCAPSSPRRRSLTSSPQSRLESIREGAENRLDSEDDDEGGTGDQRDDAMMTCSRSRDVLPPISSIRSRLLTRSLNRVLRSDLASSVAVRPCLPSDLLPVRTVSPALSRNVFNFENLIIARAESQSVSPAAAAPPSSPSGVVVQTSAASGTIVDGCRQSQLSKPVDVDKACALLVGSSEVADDGESAVSDD